MPQRSRIKVQGKHPGVFYYRLLAGKGLVEKGVFELKLGRIRVRFWKAIQVEGIVGIQTWYLQ